MNSDRHTSAPATPPPEAAHPAASPPVPAAAWTAHRIQALGTVTDLATAAAIFGLSRSTAYDLASDGRFPVPVLRFGTRYRVPVAAILSALHLAAGDQASEMSPPDCAAT